ncbi:MAG: DUF1080 domain-containing protein [Planctomycetes bacterium]|nr:DUF1080 domain-containing protein [Planctomycetota bacterium]
MNVMRHWFMWSAIEVTPGEYDWRDCDRMLELEAQNGTVGGVLDLVPPKLNMHKLGEWNHYRITCKGSVIIVELNGRETASADLNEWKTACQNPDGTGNKFRRPLKEFARRGYIGLRIMERRLHSGTSASRFLTGRVGDIYCEHIAQLETKEVWKNE